GDGRTSDVLRQRGLDRSRSAATAPPSSNARSSSLTSVRSKAIFFTLGCSTGALDAKKKRRAPTSEQKYARSTGEAVSREDSTYTLGCEKVSAIDGMRVLTTIGRSGYRRASASTPRAASAVRNRCSGWCAWMKTGSLRSASRSMVAVTVLLDAPCTR